MSEVVKLKRGLAVASPETRARVASMGGKASGGNFKHNPQRASEAGKKGALAQPLEAKAKGGRNSHRTTPNDPA